MNSRVLGLIAVAVVLVLGIWLVISRTKPTGAGDQIADTSDVVSIPDPDRPGVLPPHPTSTGTSAPPARSSIDRGTGSGAPPPVLTVPPATSPLPPTPGNAAPVASQSPTTAAPVVAPPGAPGASSKPSEVPSEQAAIDLDRVNLSLRDYRTAMSENPTGTNAEITRALNGGNPKQARLLQEGLVINPNGELVDRWGTPYFFHQLSKDHMEIRSAGPDRQMGTADDSVSN